MTTGIRNTPYLKVWSRHNASPVTSVVSRLALPVVVTPVTITFLANQSVKVEKQGK